MFLYYFCFNIISVFQVFSNIVQGLLVTPMTAHVQNSHNTCICYIYYNTFGKNTFLNVTYN